MSTRKYLPREMEDFLRLLDGELGAPVCVTVIGGAAIGLEYDTRHATTDIDVTPISDDLFWNAVARARARLPDPIPVQAVGLYAAPYDYEARRRPLAIAGLDHLTVLVPEVHDLVLMKVARGLTHDLDGVEDVHRVRALDLETLVARYYDTRTQIDRPALRRLRRQEDRGPTRTRVAASDRERLNTAPMSSRQRRGGAAIRFLARELPELHESEPGAEGHVGRDEEGHRGIVTGSAG
jgi:hypothetical protein